MKSDISVGYLKMKSDISVGYLEKGKKYVRLKN
jgi:hypothetical protein